MGTLSHDYANLHRYIGDVSFNTLARAFDHVRPHELAMSRLYFKTLPVFLNAYGPFLRAPEIQELATLELALKVAFESPEMTSLSSKDLDTLGSAQRLHFHPSFQYLRFFQNTTSLWSALVCEQVPPRPHALDCVQHLIVWRQGAGARFRIVGAEEAHAFKTATAALAQPYLHSWVEAQLVLPPKRAGDIAEK